MKLRFQSLVYSLNLLLPLKSTLCPSFTLFNFFTLIYAGQENNFCFYIVLISTDYENKLTNCTVSLL